MTWLTDNNGNKCSVEYFGSAEAAQAALNSLKLCENCTNCSDCSRCSDCSGCSGCSDLNEASPTRVLIPETPVLPDIHKQVYAAVSQPNALNMGSWHTCGTTHCRGGWIVNLAGETGKQLEEFYGTLLAAMMIYDASDPSYKISPCRFVDSNEDALADMKKLAGA